MVYEIAKIAEFTKTSIDTAHVAINLLRQIGLVTIEDNGTIYMTQVKNMVGVSTKKADDMKEARRLKNIGEQVITGQLLQGATKGATNVAQSIENRVKSIKHDNGADEPPEPVPFDEIKKLFNSICISYPKIIGIEGNRKKSVQARFKKYPEIETFKNVFEKTENSKFMKGNNKKNWKATFDWIIKPTNFLKILEGNYDNNNFEREGKIDTTRNEQLTAEQWQGKFTKI